MFQSRALCAEEGDCLGMAPPWPSGPRWGCPSACSTWAQLTDNPSDVTLMSAPILIYDPPGPSGPGLSQAALTHWATVVSPVKWSSHSNS